jgi:RNA polymerase subunit RPABC4/transcription elongation factor Spt4
LIIAAVAQESVREILNPFLGETGNGLVILLSSLIVFGAALWVIFAGFQLSPLLFDFFITTGRALRSRIGANPVGKTCYNCANVIDKQVKYCPSCGIGLETRRCKNCNAELSPSGKYCGQCGYLQED